MNSITKCCCMMTALMMFCFSYGFSQEPAPEPAPAMEQKAEPAKEMKADEMKPCPMSCPDDQFWDEASHSCKPKEEKK